jgi:maleamate amidohydrolase
MATDLARAALTDEDRVVLRRCGFGGRVGIGDRPALLIVDMTWKFTGEAPEPILEATISRPLACGERAWESAGVIARLVAAARGRGVPVIYTVMTDFGTDHPPGRWADKNSLVTSLSRGDQERMRRDGNKIIDLLEPTGEDIVVVKPKPSGFFGTQLDAILVEAGIDSLVVTGTTTSCCVRSTVVDAFSRNYRVNVVREAVFDRVAAAHEASLFDMDLMFADVISADEALIRLQSDVSARTQTPAPTEISD